MESCEKCIFFDIGENCNSGYCRRNPPMPIETEIHNVGTHFFGEWPLVPSEAWCGEWKSKTDSLGFHKKMGIEFFISPQIFDAIKKLIEGELISDELQKCIVEKLFKGEQ